MAVPERDEDVLGAAGDAGAGPSEEKQLHIPGAGTAAMGILLVSLTMLFAASTVAYLVIRSRATTWPPPGFPPVPRTLWFSTVVILASSVTVQMALSAIKRDQERGLVRMLWATFGLGLLFLILQGLNWWEFYSRLAPNVEVRGQYLGMFYVLTGLHAAHVIGGLIPLAVVTVAAMRGKYSRNFHPGVRYSTAYWHFLDVVWVVLFCVLYF
jgi:cytochrome c oxidase subunit 3